MSICESLKSNSFCEVLFFNCIVFFCQMKSNELNTIEGISEEENHLKKLGNRIKILRMATGHYNYEKFAYKKGIGRIQLRRAELGGNIKYNSLLKIIKALDMSVTDFFSEGFD